MNHPLAYDLLHELFEYRDGELYRKVSRGKVKAGDRVGFVNSKGHLNVTINGRHYGVHCIIWLMHGKPEAKMIDHIDGNPLNNRIENLRAADSSKNQMNSRLRKDSTSGIKGVSWNSVQKRWVGQVWCQRKLYRAGSFTDKQKCAEAVAKLRSELHGEFARQESIAA